MGRNTLRKNRLKRKNTIRKSFKRETLKRKNLKRKTFKRKNLKRKTFKRKNLKKGGFFAVKHLNCGPERIRNNVMDNVESQYNDDYNLILEKNEQYYMSDGGKKDRNKEKYIIERYGVTKDNYDESKPGALIVGVEQINDRTRYTLRIILKRHRTNLVLYFQGHYTEIKNMLKNYSNLLKEQQQGQKANYMDTCIKKISTTARYIWTSKEDYLKICDDRAKWIIISLNYIMETFLGAHIGTSINNKFTYESKLIEWGWGDNALDVGPIGRVYKNEQHFYSKRAPSGQPGLTDLYAKTVDAFDFTPRLSRMVAPPSSPDFLNQSRPLAGSYSDSTN